MTRRVQVLVVLSAVAVVASLAQCAPNGVETSTGDSAPRAVEATTTSGPTTSGPPSPTEPPTTEPPAPEPTAPPITFPPLPDDMVHPDAPGIIFEHDGYDIADAAILWDPDEGIYRLYSTNHPSVDPLQHRNVPMWTSPNMRDWTLAGDVLPRLPAWAQPGRTWAPEVHRFEDHWVLYPTAWDAASGRQCIGFATAPTPNGPFVPDDIAPLICQLDRHGSIDASIFTDLDGSKWLLWKSEENAPPCCGATHLFSQEVDRRTGVPFGPVHTLLEADQPWQGGLVESPSMVWGNARYWLFFSGGWGHTEGYSVAVTECRGPAGPCEPATEDKKVLQTNSQGKGPGEQGAFYDRDGGLWLAYNPWGPFVPGGIRPLALVHVKFAWWGPYLAEPPPSFWE
jgi:hypothetical protein